MTNPIMHLVKLGDAWVKVEDISAIIPDGYVPHSTQPKVFIMLSSGELVRDIPMTTDDVVKAITELLNMGQPWPAGT